MEEQARDLGLYNEQVLCRPGLAEPSLALGRWGEVCNSPGLGSCPSPDWGSSLKEQRDLCWGAWEETLEFALHHLGKARRPTPGPPVQAAGIVGRGASGD